MPCKHFLTCFCPATTAYVQRHAEHGYQLLHRDSNGWLLSLLQRLHRHFLSSRESFLLSNKGCPCTDVPATGLSLSSSSWVLLVLQPPAASSRMIIFKRLVDLCPGAPPPEATCFSSLIKNCSSSSKDHLWPSLLLVRPHPFGAAIFTVYRVLSDAKKMCLETMSWKHSKNANARSTKNN